MSENNESKFNKAKYDYEFQKKNYDRINLLFKKGTKETLNKHIKEYGYKSISTFVNEAVNEKIARDLGEM